MCYALKICQKHSWLNKVNWRFNQCAFFHTYIILDWMNQNCWKKAADESFFKLLAHRTGVFPWEKWDTAVLFNCRVRINVSKNEISKYFNHDLSENLMICFTMPSQNMRISTRSCLKISKIISFFTLACYVLLLNAAF